MPNVLSSAPIVLDLFAGCGGLALGFEVQGFRSIGYEMKKAAVETYTRNLSGDCNEVFLEIGTPDEAADVIIGGPPCQPFSQIGYQRGKRDRRDGFPYSSMQWTESDPRLPSLKMFGEHFTATRTTCVQ